MGARAMEIVEATERFWRENVGLRYLTPADARWPEGFNVHATLRDLVPSGVVLDFGCGDGRMTLAFPPERYVGVDINPHALATCRETYPLHRFEDAALALPAADVALCYTVLLHVPDEGLAATVARLAVAAPRVLVVEILGRKWRSGGKSPPVFNRESADYARAFSGMTLRSFSKPYLRYGGVEITFMDFRR